MKKTVKKMLSLLFAMVILCSMVIPAFASEGKTVRGINDTYDVIHHTDICAVYKATMYTNGAAKPVYYVVTRGLDLTAFDPNECRSYANCVKIGLSNENNTYVKEVVKAITTVVPEGADIVCVGHSLGGMVMQQVIAQKAVKDNYNVLASMALGSPYILTKNTKEGQLIRVVDKLDPIPFMSIPLLANPYIGKTAQEISGQLNVHFDSYSEDDCWDAYDALGVKNGTTYFVLGERLYGEYVA